MLSLYFNFLGHFTDTSLLLYQVWVDYQLIFGWGAVEACLKLRSYYFTHCQPSHFVRKLDNIIGKVNESLKMSLFPSAVTSFLQFLVCTFFLVLSYSQICIDANGFMEMVSWQIESMLLCICSEEIFQSGVVTERSWELKVWWALSCISWCISWH